MAEVNKTLLQKIEDLEKENATLLEQISEYQILIEDQDRKDVNKQYKDRLFKFVFGNPEHKQWTLSLYNAIRNTNYTNPDDIQFNTIGNVVYMRMKNDMSFLIAFEMDLWEHQSSFNPNMPMRLFIYGGRLYEKYIATSDYHPYSSMLQKVPRPVCMCFYNGTKEQPEKQVLKLSDAYDGEGDIEVRVTMVNINYGKNQQLMDACEPLKEYAWFVDAVRRRQGEKMDLDAAVDTALDEMPEEFIIRPFLVENRAEVKNMFLTEYDEVKALRMERQEGIMEGRERTASTMIKEGGMSASFIAKMTELSEDAVRKLAQTMGRAVL